MRRAEFDFAVLGKLLGGRSESVSWVSFSLSIDLSFGDVYFLSVSVSVF